MRLFERNQLVAESAANVDDERSRWRRRAELGFDREGIKPLLSRGFADHPHRCVESILKLWLRGEPVEVVELGASSVLRWAVLGVVWVLEIAYFFEIIWELDEGFKLTSPTHATVNDPVLNFKCFGVGKWRGPTNEWMTASENGEPVT